MNNLEQQVNWVYKLLKHLGEYEKLEAGHVSYLPYLDANMERYLSSDFPGKNLVKSQMPC